MNDEFPSPGELKRFILDCILKKSLYLIQLYQKNFNSVKIIKRHGGILYPDKFLNQNKTDYQDNDVILNIIGFILFEKIHFH